MIAKMAISTMEKSCGVFTDYSLQHVAVLARLCDSGVGDNVVLQAIQTVC